MTDLAPAVPAPASGRSPAEGSQIGPSAAHGGVPAPIVLVHGFTGSVGSWGGLVGALGGDGAPVVPVHVPGHDPARRGPEAPDCTLGAALEIIGAASPAAVHLVGYSMGGRIALHFAAGYPERVRSLVLESASPGLATPEERAARRESDEALAARLEAGSIDAFVADWERRPLFKGAVERAPDVLARERRVRLSHRPSDLAAALRGLGTGALPSLWDRLGEVRAPTTLIVGAQDTKFAAIADRMASRLPMARVAVVPGAGHTVHLDRPDAWLAEVRRHLAWARSSSADRAP